MKIVRTSVVVASMACAFVWSADSRAEDDTAKKDTSGAAKDAKGTSSGATKKDKDTTSPSGGASDTTSGAGSGASGTTETGTTGTSSDTWGTGTGGSVYDSQPSGTTYPLGSQPGTTTTTGAPYGMPQQTPPPMTSTTQTTAAMYEPTVGADVEDYKVRPNRPMLITGSAVFLGTYAATAIQGAASNLDEDRNNLIPVAGPWINMYERPCTLSANCSTTENVYNGLLIASGVAQGAGVAVMLASLFIPETKERMTATVKGEPKAQVRVLPVQMGRGGAGVGAMGTF